MVDWRYAKRALYRHNRSDVSLHFVHLALIALANRDTFACVLTIRTPNIHRPTPPDQTTVIILNSYKHDYIWVWCIALNFYWLHFIGWWIAMMVWHNAANGNSVVCDFAQSQSAPNAWPIVLCREWINNGWPHLISYCLYTIIEAFV